MKTLESIQAQIEKLQAEADEIRERERDVIIARLREAMVTYKITFKELRNGSKLPAAPGASERSIKMRTRVKYRLDDKTWSGFGKSPLWVREYLSKRGRKLDDLLVEPAT